MGLAEIVKAWKEEIGAPDVLDVVNGMGETGSALVDEVDFIQFTGSDRTGKQVMARAAETLTPVSLELGGKDPMIVLSDANIERAANAAAWGGFQNSGQTCISVERIYVEEPVYDEFVGQADQGGPRAAPGRRRSRVQRRRRGDDDPGADRDRRGPGQRRARQRRPGADRRRSGVEGPGDYYEPTVLVDVDHSMKVMRDETFGPVVGVMKVRDAEEAIRLANDTRYGLSGSVFGVKEQAEQVARRVECGVCNVNDVLIGFLATDVPFGGWKDSGIGYRHADAGIRKFCRAESLVITRFGGKRELLWFPYTKRRRAVTRRLTQFFAARDWRRRLGL